MPPKTLSTQPEYKELIDRFDCVIWHGDTLIPGVKEGLDYLRKAGKKLIFVTNNATKSRKSFKEKFDKLGLEAHVEEIFGSAYATAVYLKYNLSFDTESKKVYVIGEKGIEEELESEGIRYCGGTDPDDNGFIDLFDFSSIKPDPEVGAVICGFDMHINYKKLARAFTHLHRNEGCHFICTNADSTFPASEGLFPGAGALSAPLRYAIGQDPIVVGKPEKAMLDCILEKHHLDKSRTLMIGDRLDTDIAFGNNGGISTLLVLTGVAKKKDIEGEKADPVVVPDFVVQSFGDFAGLA